MNQGFDPYHKWLGIPPEEQPPHHYRLLAIKLFEDDADVIENAGDRLLTQLHHLQGGKHGDLTQRLMNEITAAKVCLLNRAKKAAYDAALKKRLPRPEDARPPGDDVVDASVIGITEESIHHVSGIRHSGSFAKLNTEVQPHPLASHKLAIGSGALGAVVLVIVISLIGLGRHPAKTDSDPAPGGSDQANGNGQESAAQTVSQTSAPVTPNE